MVLISPVEWRCPLFHLTTEKYLGFLPPLLSVRYSFREEISDCLREVKGIIYTCDLVTLFLSLRNTLQTKFSGSVSLLVYRGMSNCFVGQMPTVKTFKVGWGNISALKPHTPSLQATSVLIYLKK